MGFFISISQGFWPPFRKTFSQEHCLVDAFELQGGHGLKKERNTVNKGSAFSMHLEAKTK